MNISCLKSHPNITTSPDYFLFVFLGFVQAAIFVCLKFDICYISSGNEFQYYGHMSHRRTVFLVYVLITH